MKSLIKKIVKKINVPGILTLLISLLALTISYFSFYESNLKIKHNLTVSVYKNWLSTVEKRVNPIISIPTIIANRGNRSEIIIDIKIGISKTDSFIEEKSVLDKIEFSQATMSWVKEKQNILIIKPGEILYNEIKFKLIEPGHKESNYLIWLNVGYLDKRGVNQNDHFPIGCVFLKNEKTVIKKGSSTLHTHVNIIMKERHFPRTMELIK